MGRRSPKRRMGDVRYCEKIARKHPFVQGGRLHGQKETRGGGCWDKGGEDHWKARVTTRTKPRARPSRAQNRGKLLLFIEGGQEERRPKGSYDERIKKSNTLGGVWHDRGADSELK